MVYRLFGERARENGKGKRGKGESGGMIFSGLDAYGRGLGLFRWGWSS